MARKAPTKTSAAKPLQLANPPVQEVVYHVRAVVPAPPEPLRIKDSLAAELARDYPIVEEFNLYQHTVQPGAMSMQVQGGLYGLRFSNRKGTQVVHFTPHGLVMNWLKPYPGYAKCLTKAKKLWKLYAKYYSPISVEEVSMRYIDHIRIPLEKGTVNLGDYITTAINIPNIKGLLISGFNQVIEYNKVPENIRTRLNLATLPPQDHVLPILLDHEAFINLRNTKDRTVQDIWHALEQAHRWNSKFFQASLTPKCLALFA